MVLCGAPCAAPASGEPPTFRRDVMAVLSKSGCNSGACHGNSHGKGGFRLSLRGQDPAFDFDMLTREFASRRLNLIHPEQSLILLKPAGLAAHQGGVRFRPESRPYTLLRDWIAAGAQPSRADEPRPVSLHVAPTEQVVIAPQDRVQLRVLAEFSDGESCDVTSLAVYETGNSAASVEAGGLVRRNTMGQTTVLVRYLGLQAPVRLAFVPARPDFVWSRPSPANFIDVHIHRRLRSLRMNPSPRATDHELVRRTYLDACGVLPTEEEARAFVDDKRPDKFARLVDRLLMRGEFADHWALKWSDLLRSEEKVLDEKGVEVFHDWIRTAMAEGMPIDRFVRGLVTGLGSTYDNPAANFYRANRDPLTRGETTARLFLGTRLGCAKCHNHPFERWTQDDYYRWAAVFGRIDYQIVDNQRKDRLDKNEFVGEQIVVVAGEGEVKNARTGEVARPKMLGGPPLDTDSVPARLAPLAQWLTSPDNRLFASTQVNLVWYHLMGRGLVEPIDDFRDTNPGVNPELLDALADDFIDHGYDLRHLVRRIMTSRTYQASAEPNDTNAADQTNFSRAIVRRLTAEQLLDAQSQVLDAPARFAGYPLGMRAGQIPGVRRVRRREFDQQQSGDRFLRTFGKPDRLLACECERSNETTLSQAFTLISGGGLHEQLSSGGNRLQRWVESELGDEQIVEKVYWTALARPPRAAELTSALEILATDDDRFAALQDIAWALLNSKEFVFRH
jgi:hypothetical protein